jgi:hypothetical protein
VLPEFIFEQKLLAYFNRLISGSILNGFFYFRSNFTKTYYVRLSAYEDDKRIDKKNNCLLPGSYTSTKKDYEKCVDDKDDPVERYALPNEETIEWAFHILPESKDGYRFGTVQPEFGKRGGGEECFFENGTSFSTFKKQTKYGLFYP